MKYIQSYGLFIYESNMTYDNKRISEDEYILLDKKSVLIDQEKIIASINKRFNNMFEYLKFTGSIKKIVIKNQLKNFVKETFFYIREVQDEWFIVVVDMKIPPDDEDEDRNPHLYVLRYKCDELEGLLQLIGKFTSKCSQCKK